MTETAPILPDPASEYGQRVRRRLAEDKLIWLTTVSASGVPQPNPVWFLWQEDEGTDTGEGSFLIYHSNIAARLDSLVKRPHVSLHFDGNGRGGDIVVFTGTVELLPDGPRAVDVPAYVEKYLAMAERASGGRPMEEFMARYSIVSRIRPTKVRGF